MNAKKSVTATYELQLTEEEMNTILISVGQIVPKVLNEMASQFNLKVLDTTGLSSDVHKFYKKLNELVGSLALLHL